MMRNSTFDGSLLQLIGTKILMFLIIASTVGLGLPWAICMYYRWLTKHTIIDGHRLYFTGTGTQLFGNWIKWLFLTIITFGIYGFWVSIKIRQWIVKHTHFK